MSLIKLGQTPNQPLTNRHINITKKIKIMIASTKTVAFLLFTLCSIFSLVNGQALSIKTPNPTSPVTKAPTMTSTSSSAPNMIVDHFSGKAGKGGSKLSKKTQSPAYKASKLNASGKGIFGKGGKAGKGGKKTFAPVLP